MSSQPNLNAYHPDRPGIRKVLGDLEAEIMEVVWSRSIDQGTTVRDVFEVLYERRRVAYTTVMNTMTRLAKKHMLRSEKGTDGAHVAFVYYPTSTQEEFISQFTGRVLESVLVSFSGDMNKLLETLPDRQAVNQVRQLLDAIGRRRAEEEGASCP